jgi:hypothetical protein
MRRYPKPLINTMIDFTYIDFIHLKYLIKLFFLYYLCRLPIKSGLFDLRENACSLKIAINHLCMRFLPILVIFSIGLIKLRKLSCRSIQSIDSTASKILIKMVSIFIKNEEKHSILEKNQTIKIRNLINNLSKTTIK